MITGITFGSFDLLHAGHVLMFQECKRRCDHLIVGLQTDPTMDRPTKNKPIQTVFERWIQINPYVDQVIPYDTELDLLNMLAVLPVQRRFIGSEYFGQYIHGEEICQKRGINICFVDRMHTYSSSELRKRIENNESHR